MHNELKLVVGMEKIWFIIIDAQEKGPYSIENLKHLPQFTPDTLARKAGSNTWNKARFIPELKKIFEDDEKETSIEAPVIQQLPPANELVIDWKEPPQFIWLVVVVILLIYTIFRFSV